MAYTWRTEVRERAAVFGCDTELAQPDQALWRGVTVDTTAAVASLG